MNAGARNVTATALVLTSGAFVLCAGVTIGIVYGLWRMVKPALFWLGVLS